MTVNQVQRVDSMALWGHKLMIMIVINYYYIILSTIIIITLEFLMSNN